MFGTVLEKRACRAWISAHKAALEMLQPLLRRKGAKPKVACACRQNRAAGKTQEWNQTHCVSMRARQNLASESHSAGQGEALGHLPACCCSRRTHMRERTVKRCARRGPGLYARLLMFMKKYMQSTRFSSSSGSSSSCNITLCCQV